MRVDSEMSWHVLAKQSVTQIYMSEPLLDVDGLLFGSTDSSLTTIRPVTRHLQKASPGFARQARICLAFVSTVSNSQIRSTITLSQHVLTE
jgi:hypothetical protein